MRILHVTTEYPPVIYGGLGTAVGALVEASIQAGLEIAVLLVGGGSSAGYVARAADPTSGTETAVRMEGQALIRCVSHQTAIAEAVNLAQAWRPDVIHVHVFWLAHVALAIRDSTRTPIVYTVHSLDRAEYELGLGPPECLKQWNSQSNLIEAADRIVALTDDEHDLIRDYCPNAQGRVRVVGNGVADTQIARDCAQSRIVADTITILYSGRFVDRKGIRELLEAAPQILQNSPRARLVLAGGHRGATSEEMADYWLPPSCRLFRDRIRFTGWLSLENVNAWYGIADILVVPSWYEPFGMVILEGMLYGLAIVASAVGGPMAILKDERTGLLCAPKNSASLARQVIRLIKDDDLRLKLGRNAAMEVRSRWLYSSIVQRMRGVYAEMVSCNAPSPN
jgi:glycogen synthase